MYEYDKDLLELIPPEFDLDKYNGAAQLDSMGWHKNFCARTLVNAKLSGEGGVEAAKIINLENIQLGSDHVENIYSP
jgi:hypothetical protein